MKLSYLRRSLRLMLLTPVFLCSGSPVNAQLSAGIAAGFTLSQPDKAPGQAYARYIPGGGFAIGIPLQYDLTSHWALRAEPGLSQKNISMERTGNYSGTWEKRYNNYLQLPLMLQYRRGWKKLSAYAQAGLFAGYWVSARQEGAVPDIYDLIDEPVAGGGSTSFFRIKQYNEKYTFDSEKDQRFDVGAMAGIGVNYHCNSRYRFFLEFRYSQSFNSNEKDYMTGSLKPVHQTAAAMLGVMMNLNN